jgi:hypothetical protein
MKDCIAILQEKYFEALDGVLSYNGATIPVYDSSSIPADAVQPYVLLSDVFATELGEGSKSSYGQEVIFECRVVTKYLNAFGGKKQASNISDQIIQRIRTRQAGYLDLSPDFYMIKSELESTNSFEELVSDGILVNRIIRFNHTIQEV